jgi:hypothetical protein
MLDAVPARVVEGEMMSRSTGLCLAATAALLLLLGLVACNPIGPFAGGRLSGEIGPGDMQDWSAVASDETLKFETNPDDPYSVTTWFVVIGPRFYIPTSMIYGPNVPGERKWVQNVMASPLVRFKVGGKVYERLAARVDDETEYAAARTALELKYDQDPAERDPEREIWIYRMDPRHP